MGEQPLHVPNLGAKIRLLLERGPLRRKPDLAKRLEVGSSTLNNYINGTNKSPRDWVPDKRIPKLTEVLAEALPGSLSAEQVQELLIGPLAALEDALRAGATRSLEEILRQEARQGTARLRCPSRLGLVELDQTSGGHLPKVRLEEWFAIEFATNRTGRLLVLQNVQQLWGVVTFVDGSPSPVHKVGPVKVPGMIDGTIRYMREAVTPGEHRFVLFVSPDPFPAQVLRAASSRKSLDWAMLEDLARHYDGLPAHLREVHLFKLEVTRR